MWDLSASKSAYRNFWAMAFAVSSLRTKNRLESLISCWCRRCKDSLFSIAPVVVYIHGPSQQYTFANCIAMTLQGEFTIICNSKYLGLLNCCLSPVTRLLHHQTLLSSGKENDKNLMSFHTYSIQLHNGIQATQYTPISKNVLGENDECQWKEMWALNMNRK